MQLLECRNAFINKLVAVGIRLKRLLTFRIGIQVVRTQLIHPYFFALIFEDDFHYRHEHIPYRLMKLQHIINSIVESAERFEFIIAVIIETGIFCNLVA